MARRLVKSVSAIACVPTRQYLHFHLDVASLQLCIAIVYGKLLPALSMQNGPGDFSPGPVKAGRFGVELTGAGSKRPADPGLPGPEWQLMPETESARLQDASILLKNQRQQSVISLLPDL